MNKKKTLFTLEPNNGAVSAGFLAINESKKKKNGNSTAHLDVARLSHLLTTGCHARLIGVY
jgi:hypothetical protein